MGWCSEKAKRKDLLLPLLLVCYVIVPWGLQGTLGAGRVHWNEFVKNRRVVVHKRFRAVPASWCLVVSMLIEG